MQLTSFNSALKTLADSIDARLTLASLLLQQSKDDEAISLLSPPNNLGIFCFQTCYILLSLFKPDIDWYIVFWLTFADYIDQHSPNSKPWWLHEKIKIKICSIYREKGMLEEFVNEIYPLVRESLYCCETQKRKVIMRKPQDFPTYALSLSFTYTCAHRYFDLCYILCSFATCSTRDENLLELTPGFPI